MKIKRLASISLAVCLILASGATAFAATPSTTATATTAKVSPQYASPNPPGPGTYNSYFIVTAQPDMYVRSGPGDNYSPIGTVLYGDSVYVYTVNSNEWAYIGNGGYVSAYYLTSQN